MTRWRYGVAMACLPLFSTAAISQQVWLGARPGVLATEFRGQTGRRVTFLCPATATQPASVWGTDSYTDDSMICPAAIHAGILQPEKVGVVTIVMGAGAESFQGSPRNGVTSQGYGPWSSSYTFSRTGEPGRIDWKTGFLSLPINYPDPIIVVCPPDGSVEWRIWGTDVYAHGSSICVAGVHAGIISRAAGGQLAVTMHSQGLDAYPATTRNGVSSLAWAPGAARDYAYSFTVTRAAISVSGPSAPGARSESGPTVRNLGRTIDLPAVSAVGTSTTVQPRTIDLPAIAAVGTSTTVEPRIIDLPGITATGAFAPAISRNFALPGFAGSGAPPPAITRTVTLAGFTGSGAPPAPITRTFTLTGFTGSGIPRVAPKTIVAPELPPGGSP